MQEMDFRVNHLQNIWEKLPFLCEEKIGFSAHYEERTILVFQEILTSIGKMFISRGELSTKQWLHQV